MVNAQKRKGWKQRKNPKRKSKKWEVGVRKGPRLYEELSAGGRDRCVGTWKDIFRAGHCKHPFKGEGERGQGSIGDH